MHEHHATLRLLLKLLSVVCLGSGAYLLLVYGLAQAVDSAPVPVSPSAVPAKPIATTTPVTATSSPAVGTSTTTPPSEQGLFTVTQSDNNTTVHLTKNEYFVITLGDGLKWNLIFNPIGILSYVPNSLSSTTEGIYVADAIGTTTMRATGAPICKPDQACPMFLAVSTITFVIK